MLKIQRKLWDFFGDRGVFSESPDTFFNCFEEWSYTKGVFCYRMKPVSERVKTDLNDTCSLFFKGVRFHDAMECFITPESDSKAYDDKDMWVMLIQDDEGEDMEVLENLFSIPYDFWKENHISPDFRRMIIHRLEQ